MRLPSPSYNVLGSSALGPRTSTSMACKTFGTATLFSLPGPASLDNTSMRSMITFMRRPLAGGIAVSSTSQSAIS